MGEILADLQIAGISPVSSDFLQIVARGHARAELHFLSRMAGNPSGPGAALVVNSLMASANWESVKLILSSTGLLVSKVSVNRES